jgi:hypothetical protein
VRARESQEIIRGKKNAKRKREAKQRKKKKNK